MVQETVQAVKEAEGKAEQIIKEARENARTVIDRAEKEADTKRSAAEALAKEKGAALQKTLEQDGKAYLEKSLKEAEEEIAVLKAEAAKKTESAVEAVISGLI